MEKDVANLARKSTAARAEVLDPMCTEMRHELAQTIAASHFVEKKLALENEVRNMRFVESAINLLPAITEKGIFHIADNVEEAQMIQAFTLRPLRPPMSSSHSTSKPFYIIGRRLHESTKLTDYLGTDVLTCAISGDKRWIDLRRVETYDLA
jgi:hypothetical protein